MALNESLGVKKDRHLQEIAFQLGTSSFRVGTLKFSNDSPRACHFFVARRQDAIDDDSMLHVDCGFRGVSQATGEARLDSEAFGIAEGVWAINRHDACRLALNEEARTRVLQFDPVAPALGTEAGGHVLARHQACRNAWMCGGDGKGPHKPGSGFDVGHYLDIGESIVSDACGKLCDLFWRFGFG